MQKIKTFTYNNLAKSTQSNKTSFNNNFPGNNVLKVEMIGDNNWSQNSQMLSFLATHNTLKNL